MVVKTFEHTIPFVEHKVANGVIWLPLVTVYIYSPTTNERQRVSMIFDTGADTTTLRSDMFGLLGLTRWNEGRAVETSTAGSKKKITVYEYDGIQLEFLGRIVRCPIRLAPIPTNPLFSGLFGRRNVFNNFGFGFWERGRELYVTATP